MKVLLQCDWCGCQMERYESQIKPHNFCSRRCLADFSSKSKNPTGYNRLKNYENMSKHFTELNAQLNPSRMTTAVREKIRNSRIGSGTGKGYVKLFGRHEHRVVAEHVLGRKLLPGEVVHHIDGNKQNNVPENLLVFDSQAEHAKWHKEHEAEC